MYRGQHNPNFKNVTCNKCLMTAHAPAGKRHRRCSGNPDTQKLRGRGENLPIEARGTWE